MHSSVRPIVIDNGGGTLKGGFAGDAQPTAVFPNLAARIKRQQRVLLGSEVDTKIRDHSQLQYIRPIDRGYVTDTSTQTLLWEKLIGSAHLNCRAEESTLLYTCPPFAPAVVQKGLDELVFETIGFQACVRSTPAEWLACTLRMREGGAPTAASRGGGGEQQLSASSKRKVYDAKLSATSGSRVPSSSSTPLRPCVEGWWPSLAPAVPRLVDGCALPVTAHGTGVVVDVGFSFTTVTPMHNWRVVGEGIRRLPVGGKLLTNVLKECLSYRQFNVMDDPWMVDSIKERLCYVAQDFPTEHALAMRLASVSTVPPALARLTARATARVAAGHDALATPPDRRTAPASVGRDAVSATVRRVYENVNKSVDTLRFRGAGVGGGSGELGHSTGDSLRAVARPLATSFAPSSDLSPPTRPTTGDDGTGLGIRRQFVLPDYVHVHAGYVVGSSDDPSTGGAGGGGGGEEGAAATPAAAEEGRHGGDRHSAGRASTLHDAPEGGGGLSGAAPTLGTGKRPAAERASSSSSRRAKKGAKDLVGADSGRPAKRKRGEAEADVEGGEGSGGGSEEDTSSMSSSSSGSEEEEDAGEAAFSKRDSEYKGGSSKSGGAPAAVPLRQSSSRASKAGVSALTSTLRRGGLLAEGDEDEDAGGAIEGSNRMPLGATFVGARAEGGGVAAAAAAAAARQEDAQVMGVGIERLAVPEALFSPTHAGVDSVGLADAVLAAVHACPRHLWPALLASVVLVGGTTKLPGLQARLQRELAALAPPGAPLGLFTAADPVVATWQGGSIFGCRPDLPTFIVTKEEYAEHGSERLAAKFAVSGGGPASEHLETAHLLQEEAARRHAAPADGQVGQGGAVTVLVDEQDGWDGEHDSDEDY